MKKKLLALAMMGVLSLTAVGFGYAKWSSTVDAKVTVNTGTVQIGIRDVGTNDDGTNDGVADYGVVGAGLPNAGSLGADPQWTAAYGGAGINGENKDVASKISENTGNVVGEINGVQYYDAIAETINNGYPYYGPTTEIEIASLGSVPVKLENLNMNWTEGSVINSEYYEIYSWTITMPDGTTQTGSGTDNLLTALRGIQLHKNDVIKVAMKEGIRQTNRAGDITTPQNASGTQNITITASQWNEVQ